LLSFVCVKKQFRPKVDSNGEITDFKYLTESWKSGLACGVHDRSLDNQPIAVADKQKGQVALMLTKLGGRVLVATPLRKPDGERDIYTLVRTGRPFFYILTDIFGTSNYVFARLNTVDGPDWCTAYDIPIPTDWQSPLQFACMCGLSHVAPDVMGKVFNEITPGKRPPSTKPRQLKELLKMFAPAWGLSQEQQDELTKACVKKTVGQEKKETKKASTDDTNDGQSMADLVAACCNSDQEEDGSGERQLKLKQIINKQTREQTNNKKKQLKTNNKQTREATNHKIKTNNTQGNKQTTTDCQ